MIGFELRISTNCGTTTAHLVTPFTYLIIWATEVS